MKEDGRKFNGGHNKGGRKPKAEEELLLEKLSPYDDDMIEVLIHKALTEKDMSAIKLFFSYRFGAPKQKIETKDTTEEPDTNTMNSEELRKYLAKLEKETGGSNKKNT